MKIIYILITISSLIWAQIEIPKHNSKDQVIYHIGYTLLYNEDHEQPDWVAYELTVEEVAGSFKRKDRFRSDPNIKTKSASLADYKGSGYDRGHLAPAADMKWSKEAMSESFFMSNMSPQKPGFNRGIWKKLESNVRKWAVENGSIYIVTGGVLKGRLQKIGLNEVSIPEYYYKVILDYRRPEIKGIGFIIKNQKSNDPISNFAVSIDKVEEVTGIDFFHTLPDAIENEIELKYDMEIW